MSSKKIVQELLAQADVRIDGDRPWDIRVHNEKFYNRVLSFHTLGLGESYMEGWWDCDDIPELFYRIIRSGVEKKALMRPLTLLKMFPIVLAMRLTDSGSRLLSKKIGEAHYDVGNDLYTAMLDKRLTYTCGYWKDAENVDEAQEAKFELICQKVGLKPGMRVLDIGCGWGSFMKYAAEKYGVECVGITVSREQVVFGEESCKGLPITFTYADYREFTDEPFDRIISIGMFEHVGEKYFETFFLKAKELLKPDGLFLLHTIAGQVNTKRGDAWADRYIFPGGMLPSLEYITRDFQSHFIMEDWHNFGFDYSLTLKAWHANVSAQWEELAANNPTYDEKFIRMWNYYLLHFAGSFAARRIQLWQIVLSPTGVKGGYQRVA